MAYILDGLVILILLLCIWRGKKNGLVRGIVTLVGFVAAAILAGQLAGGLAQTAYDEFVEPKLMSSITERVEAAGEPVEIGLSTVFGDNEFMMNLFESYGLNETVTVTPADWTAALVNSSVTPAIETVVQPAAVQLLTLPIALVLFLVGLLAVWLIAKLADKIFKLPVLKQANEVGGLIFGALTGVFWAMLFAFAVHLAAGGGLLGDLVTPQTVEQTKLLPFLLSINPIL